SADLDKASESNERNCLRIISNGRRVGVEQIAGLGARRIVCFVREGAAVAAGERIGMIRFGSRVDVYLPAGARPLVAEGQTAIAGETVIADLAEGEPQRRFLVGYPIKGQRLIDIPPWRCGKSSIIFGECRSPPSIPVPSRTSARVFASSRYACC